jgi:hypothetical protein
MLWHTSAPASESHDSRYMLYILQILQVACQTLGFHCWKFRPDESSYPLYQDIQRISLHILRHTLYILQSLQVACENCCSYCRKSWQDPSSYHLYQDIGCISCMYNRFCRNIHVCLCKCTTYAKCIPNVCQIYGCEMFASLCCLIFQVRF